MDYRFTLNLPFTDFSMKANLVHSEPVVLDFWYRIDLYNKQKGRNKLFVLNDGPPYANGDIHIGHAFNKILKDIVVKFKFLEGYEVCFIPGWDCHGLPIELNVERSLPKTLVSGDKFRSLCRKYASNQINIQKQSFIRLGIIADWENFYKTMDKSFELAIIDSLKTMVKNEFIYSGCKPIYWCFDCSSALAEAEIEYDMKQSDSIYTLFGLCKGFFLNTICSNFHLSDVYFIVWTTTPWTLPFNEAVALRLDCIYVLVKFNGIGYILGEKVCFNLLKKFKIYNFEILLFFNSCLLTDVLLFHPLYDKVVKVLYSDHVKIDSGTGCVHIAPAYGYDDYKLSLQYKLPLNNNIDEKGFFYSDVKCFSGMHIDDVNSAVIDLLHTKKKLLFHEIISHRYPYCWRHKTQLIFRTTKQWFFNMSKSGFREKLLDVVSNSITWIPSLGKSKMLSMLKDRPDWCLSRQRMWGIPLILFVDHNGIIHPNILSIIEKSLSFIKMYGVDFWYKLDVFDLFSIDKTVYDKVIDVLDVWFDSSVVYKYISNFYGIKLPFDLCIEGSDQYRGWFQVSLINSIANYSVIPYKTILSHGFVLDKFGRKMSKSLKNVVSPNDVILKYGADILRLWVSSVNYCFDVNISDEILSRISEAYRKIRNTFRFCLSNLYDLNFKNDFFYDLNLLEVDSWLLYRFYILRSNVLNDYLNYEFYSAYKKIYNFCIDDLGSKYLDLIKDRLYTERFDSKFRKSAQFILFYLSYNLSKLISPILSFTAEEIWSYLPVKDVESIFLSKFKLKFIGYNKLEFNVHRCIFWDKIFYLRSCVNKIIEEYRSKGFFGTSLEIKLEFVCNSYWYDLLFYMKNELHLFFLVSGVELYLSSYNEEFVETGVFGIYLRLQKSSYDKCERCWHRISKKVNIDNEILCICERCLVNLYYMKKDRFFI